MRLCVCVCVSGVRQEPRPVLAAYVAVQLQRTDYDHVITGRTDRRCGHVGNCQPVQRHVRRLRRHLPRRLLRYVPTSMYS